MLPDIWKAFTAALALAGLGLLGSAGTASAENDDMLAFGGARGALAQSYPHIARIDLSGPEMVLDGPPSQPHWNDAGWGLMP
ncbi:MAG: hypothetical protein KDB71_01135 [Mycobacterium sp.]|nr:hypothetical protein [Mycobacterium sp.]